MLKNGTVWKDTDGNPIHAHGGYMIYHEGYYYWYGEDRRFYIMKKQKSLSYGYTTKMERII